MENVIEIGNNNIFNTAGYTLIFVIYGYIIYHLFKFILTVLSSAYKTVITDLKKWHSGK